VIGAAVLAPIAATIVKEVRDSVNGDSSHDHAA
jgi:hypothetical protein